MTHLLSFILRLGVHAMHDDSLRANQFADRARFSPYTAALFPRF